VLKARSPYRAADIDSDAALARTLVRENEARIAAMWPRSEGNCEPSDKPETAGQQGARASLEALLPTLQQAADAIEDWACQSRLERLLSWDSHRVELVTGSTYEESWSDWLAALAAEQGRPVSAVVDDYGTPAAAEPGDDGFMVLARLSKTDQDFTELERDCHNASFALFSLRAYIETFLRAIDNLRHYGRGQPNGSRT